MMSIDIVLEPNTQPLWIFGSSATVVLVCRSGRQRTEESVWGLRALVSATSFLS